MGKYEVRIYPTAQKDLQKIVDYLNTLSPQAALRYYDLLVEKIASLAEMPERCVLARDNQLRLRGYRILLVESYIVFYVIVDKTVQVRRVLYGKSQYEDLI